MGGASTATIVTVAAAAEAALGRKIPVVYYLCRNRHLEHPHFIEVPIASPDGLYLRGREAGRGGGNAHRGKGEVVSIVRVRGWSSAWGGEGENPHGREMGFSHTVGTVRGRGVEGEGSSKEEKLQSDGGKAHRKRGRGLRRKREEGFAGRGKEGKRGMLAGRGEGSPEDGNPLFQVRGRLTERGEGENINARWGPGGGGAVVEEGIFFEETIQRKNE